MKRIFNSWRLLLFFTLHSSLFTLLTSCGAEDTYTNHSCYFIFNTTYHQSNMLISAVTSYDGFCLVYKDMDKGTQKVFVKKNGQTDSNSPYAYTAADEPKVSELVIGYDNGLLLGYAPFDNIMVAYDRHCPQCTTNSKARLEWDGTSTSVVKCPVCSRTYDLTVTGNGLDRYPASYDGTYIRVVKN